MAPRAYILRTRDLRLAASLTLVAASAVLLLWGFWPEQRIVRVLHLDPAQTGDSAAAQPVRKLTLEFPERIRLNDRALVRLAFEAEPEGVAEAPGPEATDDSSTAEVQPIAEARLEILGAAVRPPDSIHEALLPDGALEFYWTVVPGEAGEYRGTAWSFITIKEESAGGSKRLALGAQNVEMTSVSLLGMSGEAARIVGGLSLIGGLVLALPFIDPAARWISKRGGKGV